MQHCRKYRDIANRLIRTLPEFCDLMDTEPRIAYLSCYEEKAKNRKIVYAECFKVDDKYKWCCEYDFFIVVYEPNIEDFNEYQIETLIRHELHHVGVEYTDKGLNYFIRPHDIEEFWEIIHSCGLNWSNVNATG